MDPVTVTATTTSAVPSVGFDVLTPLINALIGSGNASTFGGLIGFLDAVWSTFAVLAYLVSIVLIGLYVYASIRKNQYEELHSERLRTLEQQYNELYKGVGRKSRLDDVLMHVASDNPNDWKLAIIEADIILEQALEERGYAGISLGDKLKSVSPTQLNSLQDAWEAHKVRNRIAHEGADFVLTKRDAEEAINRYRRVFAELGVQ